MKKHILGLSIVILLFSCNTKEKDALQSKVDLLTIELDASKKFEANMNEIGVLIDSIDASRNLIKLQMIEGGSYADYVGRLHEINTYVQQTEAKLLALENTSKNTSNNSTASIRRLKADLEKRSQEIIDLQLQLVKARDENMALWVKSNEKDSILWMKDQVIRLIESEIVLLERAVSDTQADNKANVANLYFGQAEALEMAANRTQFAPRKKQAARREALELYKLSLSLGKMEAQQKIQNLEEKLS